MVFQDRALRFRTSRRAELFVTIEHGLDTGKQLNAITGCIAHKSQYREVGSENMMLRTPWARVSM